MRIKKVSQPTPIIPGTAQITDTYSTSTTDGYSCNYINSSDIYSTTEVKTNKVWLGKPVYRKVFTFTTSNTANLTLPHNLTDLNFFWINQDASYIISSSTGESLPVNWYYSSSDWARTWMTAANVRFRTGGNIGARSAYIVLEYTKASD